MFEILANPLKHPEMKPEEIASFIDQLLQEPVYPFLDNLKRLDLSYAAGSCYKNIQLPQEIYNVTEPIEKLRQHESLAHIISLLGPESTIHQRIARGYLSGSGRSIYPRAKWRMHWYTWLQVEIRWIGMQMSLYKLSNMETRRHQWIGSAPSKDWIGKILFSKVLKDHILS